MSDYLLPFQPSLAQGTNTRLDSACKHIQQCRVSSDDMARYVHGDVEELQRNKYRYCIHKDELVVGVGRPWYGLANFSPSLGLLSASDSKKKPAGIPRPS